MLQKEGATPYRVPMVGIVDAPDPAPVVAWLRQLAGGAFEYVVFMTGEGVRRLLATADGAGLRDDVVAALGRAKLVIRGPKPAAALRDVGLKAELVAAAPTTDGLIATLSKEPLAGKAVGIVLHGAENPPLTDFLRGAGATVAAVQPYVYAPAADGERVVELIDRMAAGKVDVLVITSSPQVDRLFEVAERHGMQANLAAGLAKTRVAAVGPVAAHTLEQHGAKVDICPDQGFVMKKLVQLIARGLG